MCTSVEVNAYNRGREISERKRIFEKEKSQTKHHKNIKKCKIRKMRRKKKKNINLKERKRKQKNMFMILAGTHSDKPF